MIHRVDISYKTIVFTAGFLMLLWVLYQIVDIILLLFVALILSSALSPIINRLVSWRIPRPVSIAIVFLLVFGSLIGLITAGITPIINETRSLFQTMSDAVTLLLKANYIDESVVQNELANLSRQIVDFALGIFGNLITFVTLIVITFYFLLDKHRIEEVGISLFQKREDRVRKLLIKIEEKLGAWVRGQLILSGIIGIAVYFGLLILGVPYALPLAIIAGLLEVVPIIGPIISAIPAVLIALTVSPVFAAIVTGMYLVIQQLEGHIVVPQVMKRAVGLNPILVILAVTVGSRLLGVGGALLAVPIAVVIQVVLEDVLTAQENS